MTITPSVSYKIIAGIQATATLATDNLFEVVANDPAQTPLDQFIANTNAINTIYVGSGTLTKELAALVLLGYMSAVESYFRAILRDIINVDDHAKKLVQPLRVSFGAARYLKPHMLPESILENISFAGAKGIEEIFKDAIGISLKSNPSVELTNISKEFNKICELRHCCVHRFGKLGSNNAIKLGMNEHSTFLEHPFAPTQTELETISDILRNYIKFMNNLIFTTLLERTIPKKGPLEYFYSWSWTWNYAQDRKHFLPYYRIFSTTTDTPVSPSPKEIYYDFRAKMKPKP